MDAGGRLASLIKEGIGELPGDGLRGLTCVGMCNNDELKGVKGTVTWVNLGGLKVIQL